MSALVLFFLLLTTVFSDHDTLKPDDAFNVMEELLPAQNESRELGLKLNLPPHEVGAIFRMYSKPRSRLLHVITEVFKQVEPAPTWRVIIEALRSPGVNLPHLARKLEVAHFPDPTRDGVCWLCMYVFCIHYNIITRIKNNTVAFSTCFLFS